MLFERQAGLGRVEFCLGRVDVGLKLLEHLLLGELLEHFKLRVRLFQFVAGLIDGEPIGFELQGRHITFNRQTLAVEQVLLGPAQVFLGNELFALDLLDLLAERALLILPLGDNGRVVDIAGLDRRGLAVVDGDSLLRALAIEFRTVELHEQVARLDHGAFGNDFEDRQRALDLGADLDVVRALNVAAIRDFVYELAAFDDVFQGIAQGRCCLQPRPEMPTDGSQQGHRAQQHQQPLG